MHRLSTFFADESGASAAEYALILALVAIVIIGGLTILGTTINTVLSTDSSGHARSPGLARRIANQMRKL